MEQECNDAHNVPNGWVSIRIKSLFNWHFSLFLFSEFSLLQIWSV